MPVHLAKYHLIWKVLILTFLITLEACQLSSTSTIPDQTNPAPGSTANVIPTETRWMPTITQAPSETQEPVYQVLASNSIDPSVSLEWIKSPMWEPVYEFPLGVDFTIFIPPGFVIAYEFGKTGSENFLYLLYVAPEGIINVQVYALIQFTAGTVRSVKQMSDEELQGFLDEFDAYFMEAKENGFVSYELTSDGTTLGQVFVGSEEGSFNCLSNWNLGEPVGEFCAFDPEKDTLNSEESIEPLISAFTPIGDLSLAELLTGTYDVFVPGENSSLFFQFSQ